MLAKLIGSVDQNSAFVLIIISICICIIVTSLIVKRKSRIAVNNEFELAKMKIVEENANTQFSLETERAVKFKQIDQNLITSHSSVDQ